MQIDPDEILDRRLVEWIRHNPPQRWDEYPFRDHRYALYHVRKGNGGFRHFRPLRVVRRAAAGSFWDLSGNQWRYNASDPPRFWGHHCSYCWPYIGMTQRKVLTSVDFEGRDVAWDLRPLTIMRDVLCRTDARELRELVDLDIPEDGRFEWLWKPQPYVDWAAYGLTRKRILWSLPVACRGEALRRLGPG